MKRHKQNRDIEFPPVHFTSITKTVINFKYDIDQPFLEVLYKIEKWINPTWTGFFENLTAGWGPSRTGVNMMHLGDLLY